jgi:hypothetical protein
MPKFISMKTFRNAEAIKAAKAADPNVNFPLGQIIGHVTAVTEKNGVLPDGSPKVSLVAHGEFECIVYATGQVIESGAIFLPNYYAVELQKALGSGADQNGNLLFGVEVSIVSVEGTIPYAWEIKNITGMARSRPLEALKRAMAKAGILRLPAPIAPAQEPAALSGPTIDDEPDDGSAGHEPDEDGAEAVATPAKHGKKARVAKDEDTVAF